MTGTDKATPDGDFFIPPEYYQSESFVIRSYLPGDGLLCSAALNISYDHLKPFLTWARPFTSINEAEKIARSFRARFLLNQDYVLAVLNTDETVWLGSSGFHLREGGLENLAAEIGMWIRKDAAGQGLGTQLLCELLRWGLSVWPWERLVWHCNERNTASCRTAAKAGMVMEGRLRAYARQPDGTRDDMLCFSALRTEWQDPHSI